MINYGIQHSIERPREIEVTADAVFIASNITPYSTEMNTSQNDIKIS